jgi:hypothetical protein
MASRRKNCPPAQISTPTSMPLTITGCGSIQSPVPGMNPELLDDDADDEDEAEDELLLATDVLPELEDELLEAPPLPPPPLPSTVTSVLQPDCISTPSETRSALAKNSSDERRGFMIVRFMVDPPSENGASIMPRVKAENNLKKRR